MPIYETYSSISSYKNNNEGSTSTTPSPHQMYRVPYLQSSPTFMTGPALNKTTFFKESYNIIN